MSIPKTRFVKGLSQLDCLANGGSPRAIYIAQLEHVPNATNDSKEANWNLLWRCCFKDLEELSVWVKPKVRALSNKRPMMGSNVIQVGYPLYYLKVGVIHLYFLKNIHEHKLHFKCTQEISYNVIFWFKLVLGGDEKLTQASIEYHLSIKH